MATITAKPGARPHMTVRNAPNYFEVTSKRTRYVVFNSSDRRRLRTDLAVARADSRGCGSKLLKRFNASGLRAMHAKKPQHPCYGRRSERRS